jgi:hypothetical protein
MRKVFALFVITLSATLLANDNAERAPGCLDVLRARLAARRQTRQEQRSAATVCCVLPNFLMRAFGLYVYRAFSNDDE